MTYDTFMYNGENELLEIRINELNNIVDYFVIGESEYSHSGILKGLQFEQNKHLFENFKDKIIYFNLPYYKSDNPWDFEMLSRQYILEKLAQLRTIYSNDIILHGDLDEIPNSNILTEEIKNLIRPTTILSDYFLFCLDLWGRYPSPDTFIMKAGWITQPLYFYRSHKHNFQHKDVFKLVEKAGWHFSGVMTPENIAKKMSYFAHAKEFEGDVRNPEHIRKLIKGKCGFNLSTPNSLIEYDINKLPEYIGKNQNKFKHLFYSNYK